jgi:hypothetical protein
LVEEYPLWRIWKEVGTPIRELRHEWTYDDVLRANAVLDMASDYDLAIEGAREIKRERRDS